MNFYAVLGIPRDADEEMIRSAYRILARRYHPDRGADSSAEKFRQVNEAYETLIHSGSRHTYDLSLHRTEHVIPVRVEPMVTQRRPFPQEDAGVFGRFEGVPRGATFRSPAGLYEQCDRWFRSLDDLFFGP